MKVILCGCMAQRPEVARKVAESYRFVDIVFGTFALPWFPLLLYTNMTANEQTIDIKKEIAELENSGGRKNHRHFPAKASVNIMFGCDNYCTYCIVPYVRGHERSRAAGEILNEVRALAADGAVEVCLLGQNVNSYGGTLGDGASFPELLRMVCAVNGIERVRFMTSHPKDLSDELIQVLHGEPKVCKHLHLPMQSGSSSVLKRMNRRYGKEDYLELVRKLKSQVPEIALTTDIIVGFPGETEEDFSDTLDVVRRARFAGAFTFIYSKRGGTPAAEMEAVSGDITRERFGRLLSILNPIIYEEAQRHKGKKLRVLTDERRGAQCKGRADDNSLVHFTANDPSIQPGAFAAVEIKEAKTFYLTGEAV